jgi:hypothetical protein
MTNGVMSIIESADAVATTTPERMAVRPVRCGFAKCHADAKRRTIATAVPISTTAEKARDLDNDSYVMAARTAIIDAGNDDASHAAMAPARPRACHPMPVVYASRFVPGVSLDTA